MAEPNIEFLINSFAQTTGREGAESLIYEAIDKCSLPRKTLYTKEEFLQICEELKKKGGHIKILATIASTSI